MHNYHDWVFWILLTTSIINIVAIVALISDREFVGGLIAILIFFAIVIPIGWGVVGTEHCVQPVTLQCQARVITLPSSTIITVNDRPVMTITDIPTHAYLSSKTNVTVGLNGSINIYGITNWHGRSWHIIYPK